jgi:polar amino acid transport system substrate-binding protein
VRERARRTGGGNRAHEDAARGDRRRARGFRILGHARRGLGQCRGVTVELAKAAAAKLNVPLQLVEYRNSGEITAAASSNAWDISFMPQDAEREKFVDVGPAYVVYESAYLVRAGSDIRNVADVDREGIRVGGVEGTSTSRTVARR